jgi:hypothetical protein
MFLDIRTAGFSLHLPKPGVILNQKQFQEKNYKLIIITL